jgi:hypothetical protein
MEHVLMFLLLRAADLELHQDHSLTGDHRMSATDACHVINRLPSCLPRVNDIRLRLLIRIPLMSDQASWQSSCMPTEHHALREKGRWERHGRIGLHLPASSFHRSTCILFRKSTRISMLVSSLSEGTRLLAAMILSRTDHAGRRLAPTNAALLEACGSSLRGVPTILSYGRE